VEEEQSNKAYKDRLKQSCLHKMPKAYAQTAGIYISVRSVVQITVSNPFTISRNNVPSETSVYFYIDLSLTCQTKKNLFEGIFEQYLLQSCSWCRVDTL